MGLIFKTHLDLGFTNLAAEVLRAYMTDFLPRATEMALQSEQRVREAGNKGDRFVWTTGSWLVSKYLEHSRGRARKDFELALEKELIRWHALPFTFETEILDESLLDAALSISLRLDERFGTRTRAAKMTDVPGHCRGMIPRLAAAGVRFLHIGINPATPTPDVPPLFRWQHPDGSEILVCYEATYGGFCHIPGGGNVFAVAMTGDNAGPPSASTVEEIYQSMRKKFTSARVEACTMEEMAAAACAVRDRLPVVTSEIGDTWIHGYGSDPWKLAAFRSLARLRKQWVQRKKLDPKSASGQAFDENLLLTAEHTWGLDEKTWMPNGKPLSKVTDCYRPEQFRHGRRRKSFRKMEESWREQRQYIKEAIGSLKSKTLRADANKALQDLVPKPVKPSPNSSQTTRGKVRISFASQAYSLRSDGALALGGAEAILGALCYQVFGGKDYQRFMDQYVSEEERRGIWAPFDFDKPGLEKVIRTGKVWKPKVLRVLDQGQNCWILESSFPEKAVHDFGAPGKLQTIVSVTGEDTLSFDLRWFEKPACRLAEALWFSFHPPLTTKATFSLLKLGGAVNPLDVVSRGGRSLHVIQNGVVISDPVFGNLEIESLDAGLVAPGQPSLLDFHNRLPNPWDDGIHFNLHNNTWGTNFPMWYEDDARFRFTLRHQSVGL